MSGRVKGLVVTFEKDLREEDAESIQNAIGLLHGVLTVDPVPSTGIDDYINRSRIKNELGRRLFDVLKEEDKS
jgi:hypothetical protein